MILKTIRINKEENKSMDRYIDNISKTMVSEEVIEYQLKEKENELQPSLIKNEYDFIFLMNDKGQTIERLV